MASRGDGDPPDLTGDHLARNTVAAAMVASGPADNGAALSSRAAALHADAVVILAHDHLHRLRDLLLMLQGGVTAKVLHVSLDVLVWERGGALYRRSCEDHRGGGFAARARREIARLEERVASRPQQLMLIRSAADIRQAKATGRAGVIIGSEGSKLVEGSLEKLREFQALGLRVMQLTWAVPNLVVDPQAHEHDAGLTPFGRGLVREMNRLGVVVDVSHLVYMSPKAFFEVVSLTEAPLLAGHCTISTVSPQGELNDERLKAVVDTGGIVALHFCRHLARSAKRRDRDQDADLDDVIDNVEYIAERHGIEHVGLGGDYFLNDWRYEKAMGHNVSWVLGAENAAEIPNVTEALLRRGFREDQVRLVLGGNLLRLFERVCRS